MEEHTSGKPKSLSLIKPFDPWQSPLCTCPPKYSLNPYTGCSHECLYCYASSFVPRFYEPRPKGEFIKRVTKDLKNLPENSLISLSNSSDPYQHLEEKIKLTRKFLTLLTETSHKVIILTKSDLVLRDLDLLERLKVVVSITITTIRWTSVLERGAPSFERRLEALKILHKRKIPTVVRLDPIIPGVNDKEVMEILEEVIPYAKHIVLSTFKAKRDSLDRIESAFPHLKGYLKRLYITEGEKKGWSFYLNKEKRKNYLMPLIEKILNHNKSYSLCREGLEGYTFRYGCDGRFLLDVPHGTNLS